MRVLPPEIDAIATSLALLGDVAPSREAVLAELMASLSARLDLFAAGGFAAVVDELRQHDALLDERIRVNDVTGVGAGIGDDGALLLRDDGGKVHALTSGTVERL
jgi:biotin-(acetyl-CoA carboxylase) ligase